MNEKINSSLIFVGFEFTGTKQSLTEFVLCMLVL